MKKLVLSQVDYQQQTITENREEWMLLKAWLGELTTKLTKYRLDTRRNITSKEYQDWLAEASLISYRIEELNNELLLK